MARLVPRRQAKPGAIPLLLLALGCSGLERVPRRPIPPDAAPSLVRVHEAPPPAPIEHVSPPVNSDCRWQTGRYVYEHGSWVWIKGRWLAPTDCFESEPTLVWSPAPGGEGVLFYTAPTWFGPGGSPCKTPTDCQ